MSVRPETPLADAVLAARSAGMRPLQIPGHKFRYIHDTGNALGSERLAALIRDDMPLQSGADDNFYSNDWLGKAERLYAAAIGADQTRFLVNGGSQGNLTMLLTLGRDGERLALDRTSHRSVLAGLILSGAEPVWVYPDRHPDFGLPIGVSATALDAVPEVSAVAITSPSYVGTLSNVAELAAAAHARGVPLGVDQAWGAHLDFGVAGHPSALAQGADLVVTSIHKALMGYTQTAIISSRGDLISQQAVIRAADLTTTTSPSATLLASIDPTRAVMEQAGAAALDRAIEAAARARQIIGRVPGVVVLDEGNSGCQLDPLKIVAWLPRSGAIGSDIAAKLWEIGHGVESADSDTLVMTVTVTDDFHELAETAARVASLLDASRREPRAGMPAAVWAVRPIVAMTPRAAAFADRVRMPLQRAVGRISAEQFTPYPPGVPLIGPGEVLTDDIVTAIELAGRSGRVAYCSDATLQTIEVVQGH